MKLKEHVEPYYFIVFIPKPRTWSRVTMNWNPDLYYEPGSGFKIREEAERLITSANLMYTKIEQVWM